MEIDIENGYYEGVDCMHSNPEGACEIFEKVVTLETESGLDIKW